MLPQLYPDPQVVTQVLEDFETADISELHKLAWGFARRFVQNSWDSTPAHLQQLRDAGVCDIEILRWAEGAGVQTWWVMSADGGGVALDDFTPDSGRTVGLEREAYEAATLATAAEPRSRPVVSRPTTENQIAWIDVDLECAEYQQAAAWAEARYGFVPNFFKAFSLRPALYPRHQRAMELLEAPVSGSLNPRQHALVRALVSSLNRCVYGQVTSRALLERAAPEDGLWERVTGDYTLHEWSPADRAVLDFATKMARSSYKVTDKDSARLREVGLDAAAYVEILNVVSIQSSIERVANSLGVVPDERPMLVSNA